MSQSQRPTRSSTFGAAVAESASSPPPPTPGSEPPATSASAPVKRRPGRPPKTHSTSMSAPPESKPQISTTPSSKSSRTQMVLREKAPPLRASTQAPRGAGRSDSNTTPKRQRLQENIVKDPCERCLAEAGECIPSPDAHACERCALKKKGCSHSLPHARSRTPYAGEPDAGGPANGVPASQARVGAAEKEGESLKEAKQQWLKTELAKGPCERCAADDAECILPKGATGYRCLRCVRRKAKCSYLLPRPTRTSDPGAGEPADEEEEQSSSESPNAPAPPRAESLEAHTKNIELQALLAEAKADRDAALRRVADLEHQLGRKEADIRRVESEKKIEADSKRRGLKRAEDLLLTEREAKERLVEEVEKLSTEVEKLRDAAEDHNSEKETMDQEAAELKEKLAAAESLVTNLREDNDENMLSLQVGIDDEVYSLRRIAGALQDSYEGRRIQGSVQKFERVVEACKERRLLGSAAKQTPFFPRKRELEEYGGGLLEEDGDGRRSKVQRMS